MSEENRDGICASVDHNEIAFTIAVKIAGRGGDRIFACPKNGLERRIKGTVAYSQVDRDRLGVQRRTEIRNDQIGFPIAV